MSVAFAGKIKNHEATNETTRYRGCSLRPFQRLCGFPSITTGLENRCALSGTG